MIVNHVHMLLMWETDDDDDDDAGDANGDDGDDADGQNKWQP